MPLIKPLELLRRSDKWYLGNAGMLVYAPPSPKHLDVPGFFDDCHYGDLALKRLLCVTFVAEYADGRRTELFAYSNHWNWYPDRIEARYYLVERDGIGYKQQCGVRVFLNEVRRLGPDGTLHCELSFDTLKGIEFETLQIVAWTSRNTRSEGESTEFAYDKRAGALSYRQQAVLRDHNRGETAPALDITLTGDHKPTSVQVTPAHGAELTPLLKHTPLWDRLGTTGKLSGEVNGENVLGGVVYAGLHWAVPVKGIERAKRTVRVMVRDPRSGSRPVQGRGGHASGSTPDPTAAWREFITLVPHFQCSDEMLTRWYWHRWYGLRLNAVPPGGNYSAPAVTEGIAYFRGVITYSLMCHLNECRWLSDPALARGCLDNHLAHQTPAGHLAGHIYLSHVNDRGFYHTDVGRSVAGLLSHHPDQAWAAGITPGLTRLLDYYVNERDPEGLDLYDVRDQFETGQEFTSRYFHGDERADMYDWDCKLRLKGVDVTSYVYHLARLLTAMAIAAGDAPLARRHAELAGRIKAAVRSFLWDDSQGFFVDYRVEGNARSPYKSAVGFYPLLSDLATPEMAATAAAHLNCPDGFATPWPVPTVPVNDPHFSADPRWRGERANCPWNGRVWPMVNSHLTEVYQRLAEDDPEAYRPELAAFLRRFIELMHFETAGPQSAKDLTRPNCFEHYHPLTGTASEYRGIDDYMHSWVNDLILRYVAGVRLDGARLTVDPYPFGLTSFLLTGCALRGHRVDVCWNQNRRGQPSKGYSVYIDGKVVFKADKPAKFEVEL